MQCPKCNQPLQGIDYEGVHIETCPACGGDWLDAGELQNILDARDKRFDQNECRAIAQATKISHLKLDTLNRHLTCPNCGAVTHPINYGDDSGIIIDKCASCGGVWLEKGEIEKIQELVEGWDDELPQDLAQYSPKLHQIAVNEDQNLRVHISHFHLIDSMINGCLDLLGE
jgi:Zn-finger nucleic acid-binding protein